MKKALLLLVVILLLLQSCAPSSGGAENESTDTDAVTEEEKEMLAVVADGKTEFEIIRPDETDGASSQLFASFYKEFNERYSCDIVSNSDILALVYKTDPNAKEILVGDTNREASAILKEKLEAAGGNRFGIMATDCKIVINGTGWYQCYLAFDYFFNNFAAVDESGNVSVAIECGYEYISEPADNLEYTIEKLISDGKDIAFAATEKVLKFQATNGAGTVQGGCTDGTHVYVGMMGNGEDGIEFGVVSKYDLGTGRLIKSSERIPTFHTNDLTYDAKNNRIVIATLDAGWTRLSFVDAETLEYQGDFIAPVGIRGLEYLPETNQYVAAGFDIEIMLLDENFNKLSSHICEDQTLMTQGLYSDGKYVYDPRYLEGRSVHLMVVEDMDGNLISSASIFGLSTAEPEHMYRLNGDLYIGCNHSGWLYKLEVIPQNWW